MSNAIDADILIIGGDLAGAALACALRKTGYRIVLAAKTTGPADSALGDFLQPATLEILQSWDVLGSLIEQGAEESLGIDWYTGNGESVLSCAIAELEIPNPQCLFLNYDKMDQTFLELAKTNPNFHEERPIRSWRIERHTGLETFVHIKRADDTNLRVHTRMVIGADGRNSRIRKIMAITSNIYNYRRPIATLMAKDGTENTDNNVRVYLNPSAIVASYPRNHGYRRLCVPIEKPDVKKWRSGSAELLAQELEPLVSGVDLEDLELAGVYPSRYRATERWAKDNFVLVGDACFTTHPGGNPAINFSLRCVERLIKIVEALDSNSIAIPDRLSKYEFEMRSEISNCLELNHQRNLDFDITDVEKYQELLETLKFVHTNASMRQGLTMRLAGYDTPAET